MKQFLFDDKEAFLAKLRELVAPGVPPRRIRICMPIPVREALHLLKTPPSPLRFFTFTGAFAGTAAGFGFTIYTVWSWPLMTGGKPLVSWPPFTIIAFELTILFGAIASLLGFLWLNRLPSVKQIIAPEETGNRYAIYVEE
jgi:molybdopterin-containing oxidoreductase family membrane subunit